MERGRPREFDEEEALEAALRVFWRQGYQGASLAALTEAMGMSKPSLYRAFGSKEELYNRALERYCDNQLRPHAVRLQEEPDLRKALGAFLHSVADMLTGRDLPGGCMVVNSSVAMNSGNLPPAVETSIRDVAQQFVFTRLRERLVREEKRGRLPENISVDALVSYYATLMAGMAVMSKLGVEKGQLDQTIELALGVLKTVD